MEHTNRSEENNRFASDAGRQNTVGRGDPRDAVSRRRFRYSYTAEEVGTHVRRSGTVTAKSDAEATALLEKQGLREPVLHVIGYGGGLPVPKYSGKKLASLSSRFRLGVSSGIPLDRCLSAMAAQASDRSERRLINSVVAHIRRGYTFSESLAFAGKGRFPDVFIASISAGEEGEDLRESLSMLEKYYSRDAQLRSKLAGALAYPIFLVILMVICFIACFSYIIPEFLGTLSNAGMSVPESAQNAVRMSGFIIRNSGWILLGIAALALVLYAVSASERGRYVMSCAALRFPGISKYVQSKNTAVFALTAELMLRSGANLTVVLDRCSRALPNRVMGEAVKHMLDGIYLGYPMSGTLQKEGCFPPMFVEMIAANETNDKLSEVLSFAGSFFSDNAEKRLQKFTSMVGPICISVAGLVIALFVLNVYSMMLSLYSF